MTVADVVVVGGGFSGACAARALANGKRKVVVLEALSGVAAAFRGELMHPLGVEALGRLGLLDGLHEAGGIPVAGFAVALERDGRPLTLPYGEIDGGGAAGLVMSHPDMVRCLRSQVERDPGVEFRMGARVTELLRDGETVVGVRLASGEAIHAPLTLVSDGRHSKLRAAVGAAEETKLLSFTAVLLTDPVDLPRPGFGHVFLGEWGPILAYAVPGGGARICIDLPVEVSKSKEASAAFVRERCAPCLPEPLRGAVLAALAKDEMELCATHAITTRRCSAPGVALVGDAGGCAHPLTAGGMTIALNDICTLADALDAGTTTAVALERYQERRYGFVRAREILVEALYDLFRRDDDGAQALRRGLGRYWRSGRRARSASLSLLSGRDSRVTSFVAEYLAVVGSSVRGVGADPEQAARLARTTASQLVRTARLIYLDLRRRPTLRAGLFTAKGPGPTRLRRAPLPS